MKRCKSLSRVDRSLNKLGAKLRFSRTMRTRVESMELILLEFCFLLPLQRPVNLTHSDLRRARGILFGANVNIFLPLPVAGITQFLHRHNLGVARPCTHGCQSNAWDGRDVQRRSFCVMKIFSREALSEFHRKLDLLPLFFASSNKVGYLVMSKHISNLFFYEIRKLNGTRSHVIRLRPCKETPPRRTG